MMLGELSGRRVFHNWAREPIRDYEPLHIQHMRASTLSDFFHVDALPYIELPTEEPIDASFSEWGSHDPWYPAQSSATGRAGMHGQTQAERDSADPIIQSRFNTILLETSLALKPSSLSRQQACAWRGKIYRQQFVAKAIYQDASRDIVKNKPFVGVHIRRGDMLNWDKRSRLDLDQWVHAINHLVPCDRNILLCSDDLEFKQSVSEQISHSCINIDSVRLPYFNEIELAFVEFLCLSQATSVIGTVASSFAIEAALYGNIPHYYVGSTD
jgi:hypothetical protein